LTDYEDKKVYMRWPWRRIAESNEQMLMEITKPENRFSRVLETAGTVVTIASVLGIIEIIRNWIRGG
jgi:hypothetical protein